MPGRLTITAGPARSGKTHQMLGRYRQVLRESPPGTNLWLAPTVRAVEGVRERLLAADLGACFAPRLMTFAQFARWTLQAGRVPLAPLDQTMKRHLLRRLVQEHLAAGRLHYFASIARSGGLASLLVPWISELKRLEIWPEQLRRACSSPALTARDAELLGLYEDYQAVLHRHNLFDYEGCFWSARTLLQQQGAGLLGGLRLVVVDGFADFTRTEYEMLEVLAQHAAEMHITLPLEESPCRGDLFGKSRETLSQLRSRCPGLEERHLPRRPSGWPAMDGLESRLFLPPAQAASTAETTGLEILAAAGEEAELERIGVRIKRLLVEGDGSRTVRPQEIAVVFRSTEPVAPLVEEVFGRLGIPFALETRHRLNASPLLRQLLAVLRLETDDWPLRGLLSLLANRTFDPPWPEWQGGRVFKTVDRTIRSLQIPRGKAALLGLLEKKRSAAVGQALPCLTSILALLRRLADTLQSLPQRETLTGWADAWRRLAEELGIFPADPSPLPRAGEGPGVRAVPPSALTPALTWSNVEESLLAGDRLAQHLGQSPPQLDRAEALAVLADVIHSTTVPQRSDTSGRVQVLSARSARTMEFPYLFFAGLSERSFPAPVGEGRLYGQEQQQRLIDGGLPLPSPAQRASEEMLLFYEVVTRATRRLWFSYPALDEAGQPLSPSPYLQEVEQACGGEGSIRRSEPMDLSPLPPDEEPLSADAFRIRAVADAMAGNISLLAGLVRQEPAPGLAENLLAGLAGLEQRSGREQFGSLEGWLTSPAARDILLAQFTPDRVFSVTELEAYAECPFRFLMERVLRIEPLEELELRPDYLARGRRAHQLWAALHTRLNAMQGHPSSPAELDPQQYEQLCQSLLSELHEPPAFSPLAGVLQEIDRRVLGRWLVEYRAQHAKYDQMWAKQGLQLRPAFFEVPFGGPNETPPLELRTDDCTVRLSGRIDRIDLGTAGNETVFNIVDYKTGGSTQFDAESAVRGLTLQLPLYAVAVEELLLAGHAAHAWQAGYWYLAERGFPPKKALQMHRQEAGRVEAVEGWPALREEIVETVFALLRGLREGEFPVYNPDPECTGVCPFRTVCRINQIRSLEKTWQPSRGD